MPFWWLQRLISFHYTKIPHEKALLNSVLKVLFQLLSNQSMIFEYFCDCQCNMHCRNIFCIPHYCSLVTESATFLLFCNLYLHLCAKLYSQCVMSFLFSLTQRYKDDSTQMNFDEMVQFEGQAHGAYFTSVEQYLELAIDLAVRDTIKHQVYQGSLLRQNTVSSKIFYFYSLGNTISLGEFLTSSSSASRHAGLWPPLWNLRWNAYFTWIGDFHVQRLCTWLIGFLTWYIAFLVSLDLPRRFLNFNNWEAC